MSSAQVGGGGLHSRIWRASSLNVTLHNHANFHLLGSVSNQHDADVSSGGVDPEHPGCSLWRRGSCRRLSQGLPSGPRLVESVTDARAKTLFVLGFVASCV